MKQFLKAAVLLLALFIATESYAVFPSVRSFSTYTNANNDPHSITLPATIESGDIIACFGSIDGGQSYTWPTTEGTFTQEYEISDPSYTGYLETKIADGTEDGASLSIDLGGSEGMKVICLAIQDSGGALTDIDSAAIDDGFQNTPDPPNLASGFSGDVLWIAVAHVDNNTTVTTWPASYTDNQTQVNAGLHTISLALATQDIAAGTEDPGAWTWSTNRSVGAATVAIQPSGGGGGATVPIFHQHYAKGRN